MKKGSDIIKSFQKQPSFKKLKDIECINKIKSILLPVLQKFVSFGFVKNKTLFLVLNHYGGKQEIDNNIKTIKELLKSQNIKECLELDIQDIKTFVSHKPEKLSKELFRFESEVRYYEKSNGEFNIDLLKDEKLKSLAKEIKGYIKSIKESYE